MQMSHLESRSRLTTKTLVRVAFLAVMGFIIMYLAIPLPFAPPFMKLDFGDLPSLIGAFAMGPVAGSLIVFIKVVLHALIKGTSTFYVGELSNFIVGATFCSVASLVYRRKRTLKRAILGLLLGTLAMSAVAMLSNYFVIFPLYGRMMHLPMEAFVEMTHKLNAHVSDVKTLFAFAILPFNLVKGVAVSLLTLLMYKRISPILKD